METTIVYWGYTGLGNMGKYLHDTLVPESEPQTAGGLGWREDGAESPPRVPKEIGFRTLGGGG